MSTPRRLDRRPRPMPVRAALGLAVSAVALALATGLPALGSPEGGTPPPAPPTPPPAAEGGDTKPAETPAKPAGGKDEPPPKNLEEVMERINKLSKAGHKAFLGKQYPVATETVTKLVALSAMVKDMLPPDVAKDAGQKKQFLSLHEKMDKSLQASKERLEKKQFKEADLEYKKSLNVCTQCHRQFRIEEDEEMGEKKGKD